MVTIYTCLVAQHDWRLVLVAVAICLLGSVVSVALWRHVGRVRGRRRAAWLALAAATAAAAVWATHFVAMLAHKVRLDHGLSLPLTLLSFLAALALMVPASLLLDRARRDRRSVLPAGAALAVAVGAMHYTGMAAYRGGAWMSWDGPLVVASLVTGLALFSAAAACFASRRRAARRLATPSLLALGIAALHFTGMSAVTLTPMGGASSGGLSGDWLAPGAVVAVLIVLAGAGAALWQDRAGLRRRAAEAERLRALVTELSEARDAARAAAEAKSRFLATMSHELRTPLNGVLGLAQVLQDTPLDAAQREAVDTILASGDALVAIVDDILDAARAEAGQVTLDPAPFEPAKLIGEVARLLAGQASAKGLRLEAHLEPGLPRRAVGDAVRLRQILLNLVGNAIKFTEAGSVRIEAAPGPGPEEVTLAVRDTGMGIKANRLDAIFAPFTQADDSITRRFGGTGLGLTISRELARLMGGDVEVESRPGRGSIFRARLRLPAADGAGEPRPEAPSAFARREPPRAEPQGAAERRRRVLVADDARVNRLVLRRLLPPERFAVEEAQDGRAALEAVAEARASGDAFDAVLMDVSMPVMDGLAATAEIRAEERRRGGADRLAILAVTAHAAPENRARCLAAGMDGVLVKPLSREALLGALDAAILPVATGKGPRRAGMERDDPRAWARQANDPATPDAAALWQTAPAHAT